MNILFVAGSFNQGGAEYQLLALANLMKNRNNNVFVLALTDYDFFKPFLIKNGIEFRTLRNDESTFLRVLQLTKFIRSRKPDVIISFMKVPAMASIIAKMLSGVKCKLLLSERTALIQNPRDIFHFSMWHYADMVTTNSISKFNYLNVKFPLLRKKLNLVYNIYDNDCFENEFKIEIPFSVKKTDFVFVGRISPEKNLRNLIEALGEIKRLKISFKFNIYGDTRNETYSREIYDLIKTNGMEDCVFLNGTRNSEELKLIYKSSGLLFLLSEYEGFSNVLAEALINGCIVLVSNIPENTQVIKDGENGFCVESASRESIVSGLMRYMNLSDSELERMSTNNFRKAEEVFNLDAAYLKYISIINES
jgi:glycosyltransferase involved in cell wall biosynthesis